MKKLLPLIFLFLLFPSNALAEKNLTVGETLTLYFTELFPKNVPEIYNVTIKYSGIGTRSHLRGALQKGMYYGMIPNVPIAFTPDRPMTERIFLELLQKHFGMTTKGDASGLTFGEYETFMKTVRGSYTYELLHMMNDAGVEKVQVQEQETKGNKLSSSDNYYLLEEIYALLREKHLRGDKLLEKNLIYGAVEGLVNELGDEHTTFFRPDVSTDFINNLDGNIIGIGVVVDIDAHGSLTITDVIPHSPAEKAGVSAGDTIQAVDGIPVDTKDGINDDISRLRGKISTTVTVTLKSNTTTKTVIIIRELIKVPIVETHTGENNFRITFGEVTFGSDKLIFDALQAFFKSNRKRLILDLRNNPGGSMAETRTILNYFIEAGHPLVTLKYPQIEVTNSSSEKALANWSQYEIVILINKDTASAAEIIATTLREYFPKNVVLLGETTYGKGSVQELISFDDKSLLKYTIAEWFTPIKKLSIDKKGIEPDKKVVKDPHFWKSKKIDTQILAAEKYIFTP